MKTIVVASTNPVKQEFALNGFCRVFPAEEFQIYAVPTPSGVSNQPKTNQEALYGACNRANAAFSLFPQADYWVGIEGGIEDLGVEMAAFAWIVVRSKDRMGKGRTGTFFLPGAVADLVRQGMELGEADDIIFNRMNSKQENGAIGILTNNIINRSALYTHAVILALVPFLNSSIYTGGIQVCNQETG